MKINLIPTYQQGGAYAPPYAVYQPIPSASQATGATASSSSSESKGLTDKDLLQMLEKLDGLPNDMTAIANQLQNFYVNNSSKLLTSRDTAGIEARFIGLVNQIKIANFSKKEYDNAYNQVSKNGGIDEVAINDRGQFVCMNKDSDFKFMTAEQLKESDGEYMPLTNSELLNLRATSKDLVNNDQPLSVVQNGIGMEVVTEMIQKALNGLGTAENSQEGYTGTKRGRLIQGLQDFEAAVQEAAGTANYDGTVSDLYKYKFLTKEQATNASEAFAYIYSTLPNNAKALLKYKSDLTEEGAQRLVQSLIASKLDSTQQFDIDLKGGPTSKTTAEGAGKDTTKLKDSQLIDMVKSISGIYQPMEVDRGDGIQMTLLGRRFNMVTGRDGKAIGPTSLANMILESGIQGITKDLQNITFGDQKVSAEALKNITYNNTGAIRVNLPITADGSVDFSVLSAYEKAEAELEALGREPTPDDYKEAYESVGLDKLLNANGMPNQDKFGAFLVTEGYTTDALSGIEPSDFVREFRGDNKKAAEYIKTCLTEGTGKDKTVPSIDTYTAINPADWFGWHDKIYKAAIYIPIDNSTLMAARLDKQYLDYDEALQQEELYQNQDKTFHMQTTSSSVLGL